MTAHFSRLSVVVAASAAALTASAAAPIKKTLDVSQALAFKPDVHAPVGCIQSMTVGKATLAADLETKFPLDPRSTALCVAVLSSFEWSTGVTDPLLLAGRVSPLNKAALDARGPGTLDVTFQLAVYEYDAAGQKYYASISSGSVDLKGTVEPSAVTVGASPATAPAAPVTHELSLTLKPQSVAQKLLLAFSPGKILRKTWGAQ